MENFVTAIAVIAAGFLFLSGCAGKETGVGQWWSEAPTGSYGTNGRVTKPKVGG